VRRWKGDEQPKPDADTLPNDQDAERSVLGAVLANPKAMDMVSALAPEDFYTEGHQSIFRAQRDLSARGVAVDLVTLKNALATAGQLKAIGGPAYLASLENGMPRSVNIGLYAGIVCEKALLRAVVFAGNDLVSSGYAADETATDIIQRADRTLVNLSRSRTGRVTNLATQTASLFEEISWRSEHRDELLGIHTGFPSIDAMTLGWQRGDLVIVAARPSIDKTVFALNTAIQSVKRGKQVLFFSFEMNARSLYYRALSSESQVPLMRLRSGALGSPDFAKLANGINVLPTLPLLVDDMAGQTVWDIRSTCRRQQADGGLDLVLIDYVQLIPGSLERRGANRNEEITDISRKLKLLAGDLNVPVVLLSQLSRAAGKRTDPTPELTDLRESGALEQDGDVVGFLHRKNHREDGVTKFIIAKARNGPTGTLNLTLHGDVVTFTDGGDDPAPAAKRTKPGAAPAPSTPKLYTDTDDDDDADRF